MDTTSAASSYTFDFLFRRLHSLTGVIPVGVFLIMHLTANSMVAFSSADADYYQAAVDRIHSLGPFLIPVEVFGILLPIAFHALLGLKIWRESKSNVRHYPYWCNFRYSFQRISGVVVLAFILVHLWHMHWLSEYVPGGRGALFDPHVATPTAAYAMQIGRWWTIPVYALGITCACYHFATGLWTFMITWGVTVGGRAQDRMGWICAGFGVILGLVGISAQIALLRWPTPEPRVQPTVLQTSPMARESFDQPAAWPAADRSDADSR
ncbi:MAG TPA: succinate dehydrogenase [Phycisphaerae bacterium]|nr:succinate dehydrogenase [Phycisphaerae bacterium]